MALHFVYALVNVALLFLVCVSGFGVEDRLITPQNGHTQHTNRRTHHRDHLSHHGIPQSHDVHQTRPEHGSTARGQQILLDVQPHSQNFSVDDDFISSAIDMSVLTISNRWLRFNFSSVRMRALLGGLSPTTLRLGGGAADWMIFDRDPDRLKASRLKPEAVVLTKADVDNLVNLTLDTNARFLMDLNLQVRFGQQWDPVNSIDFFNYCVQKGYGANIDWELGNESDQIAHGETLLSPKQIGEDFISLRKLLNTYNSLKKGRLVGPDVVGVEHKQGKKVLTEFANIVGQSVDALTFHHYYFRGDVAKWQSYINPNHFANLEQTIAAVRAIVANSTRPSIPLWIGETSDSWHSGTPNVSDRFISGFLWMDKLGLSAQKGVRVVIRQTFYGPNYALLDLDMNPNPDYWLTYVHKRLVGRKVLQPTVLSQSTSSKAPYVRVYAHCTAPSANYTKAVTFFGLNVSPNTTTVLQFAASLGGSVDVYLLQPSGPDALLSKYVALNGVRLQMVDNSTLPSLRPVRQQTSKGVKLPPLTFGFMVFPDVKTDICSQKNSNDIY